ncbi:glycoside hydrolase family 78 protein [Paenibacillus puerhi]|uniref:glycoside hydrolase family 78 protein n=1 Tax=Paenibacillus puerhi TaxID=2692622 RepID=UPI00135ADE89|nr:family 16 glycoside hydrolase [Paenibacillus puerhi]
MKYKFLILTFILLIAQLVTLLTVTPAQAAQITTLYVELASKTIRTSPITGGDYYSAEKTWKTEFDLSSYITGNIESIQVNLPKGKVEVEKFNLNTIQLEFSGMSTPIYGRADTNPGHQIYRLPDGKRWEHKGERTPIMQFVPDDASSGVSQRPGLMPNQGYVRQPGNSLADPASVLYSGWDLLTNDLRYSSGTPPKGISDKNPNPSFDGAAATRSYNATASSTFYLSKPTEENPRPGRQITEIEPGSIRLTGASTKHPGIEPYFWGYVEETNTNQIAVRRKLEEVCNGPTTTCNVMSSGPDNGKLVNYIMEVNTEWQANTFAFSAGATITVNYKVPEKPDLAVEYIKHDKACIQVGDTVPIKYAYRNIGISTTTPFKVQLKVDGVVIHTENADGGASKDVLLGASANYKFTSTSPKSFTLVVDSGNAVNEETKTNNSMSVSFQAKDDCSGGGGETGGPEVITGTLEVELPSVKYGQSNYTWLRNVSVSGGNSCKLVKGDLIYTQGSLKRTDNLDRVGTFYSGFVASPYNAFVAGTVSVQYDILTSCGTKKTIGPGSFQVTVNEGNSPPQFEPAWFSDSYYTGYGDKATMVPVGERVSLGPVKRPAIPLLGDNGTPYDPDGDDITFHYDFAGSSSSWIRWLGDTRDGMGYYPYDSSFSNIQAKELGAHTVEVKAFDGKGGVAGPYNVTLNVVDPNPVPEITLPPKVVERRPFTPDISCSKSWTPYKNRTISHCDWHGTKLSVYPTAGNYAIELDVADNTGLRSKFTAIKTLTVLPDLPPVVGATLASKGIRGTAMHMTDTSFSPDGDVLVIRRTQIIADVNMNGNFDDDPVMDMTLDPSGNFTFTPTILANHLLRIYVQEDWGLSASGEFSFTVVNQAPSVSIDVKGEYPQPPTIEGTMYDLNAMLNDKSAFIVEDHYMANRPTSMYVNATEGAIAVPDRKNMYFSAPSADGFTYSTTGFNTRITGGDYGEYIPLSTRAGQNLFYKYGVYSSCSGGAYCIPYGISLSFHNTITNTTHSYKEQKPGDYVQFFINPVADLVWTRTSKSSTGYGSFSGNFDRLYRLSDMASGNFTPYKTIPFTVTSWHYPGQYQFTEIPDNPPPAEWVPVEEIVQIGTEVPYNFVINGVKSFKPNTVTPRKDNNGNFYAFTCTSEKFFSYYDHDTQQEVYWDKYSCKLQKINPEGTVIWTAPKMYTNYQVIGAGTGNSSTYYSDYPYVDILHITADNSRIVLNDGIYNNNTGAYVGQIPGYDMTSFLGVAHMFASKGYSGIFGKSLNTDSYLYNDLLYYRYNLLTGYYSCGDDDTCSTYSQRDRVLHIRTGQLILDIAGAPYNSGSSSDYRIEYKGEVTSDGKLVIPLRTGENTPEGHRPRIHVYDMMTGALLYQSDYLANYANDQTCSVYNNDRCWGSVSVQLTGDSEGYLIWRDADYKYYSTRKFTWNIPTTSDAGVYSYGNIMDKTRTMSNGGLSVSVKFTNTTFSERSGAGITFRSADHKNYYQAELTTKSVVLSKVVNGTRTILDKQTNPIKPGVYNNLRVTAKGDRIQVIVNGVPLISLTDSTFREGRVGLFAHAPNIYLKNFFLENASGGSELVDNIVLVNTKINYTVHFSDPENDPAIPELAKWTYTNTEPEKFLDAGDGFSDKNGSNSYVNREVNSPEAMLGKVGLFRISFTEPDDPAPPGKRYPDPTYAAFRNYADPDTKMVIVHRRPVSVFTVSQNADFTIAWSDASYDPDRWLHAGHVSGEKAEYIWNRGIYDVVHGYTDPDGIVGMGKLTKPMKKGNYTLRQAVKDEYGAWSDWYEVNLWVDQPVPNSPPGVTLTFPSGSYDNPTSVSLRPTIQWSQWDPDPGTTFTVFNLVVKDEWGNCVECKSNVAMNTKNGSWAWTLDNTLTMGRKYQVQVQVADDGNLLSPWSSIGWMSTNSPPSAFMSYPWGTQESPTIMTTTRPTLSWTQTDPDAGAIFQYFRIQITNEANTATVLDTCQVAADCRVWQNTASTAGNWTSSDLPAGQKLRVRVKVWDQYGAESEWSPQVWMLINRPPTGNLVFEQPIYEHDTPLFTVELSDPDDDALTVTVETSYQGGAFEELKVWTDVPSGESRLFHYGPLQEGMYRMRLTLTDRHGGRFQQSYTVPVLPLTLTGWVRHTPEWESYRQAWNAKFPERERMENEFWAGEAFKLSAAVTDTGSSSTKPVAVTSRLLTTEESVELTRDDFPARYAGMLLNTDHVRTLSQGGHTFRFTVDWSNGLTRHYDVPVRIVGSIYDVIVQQIRH